MLLYICQICNRSISKKGFGSHLFSHNISAKEYYDKYLKKEIEGICPVCSKETPFLKISKGYQTHCSIKCSQKSKEISEKRKETFKQNHNGASTPFQIKETQIKAEKNSHSKEANQKKKETSLKHYGTENPVQSKEVQAKMQQTNLERYGSRAYNHTKGKQTMKELYNYEYALQLPEFKEKQEQTEKQKWINFANSNNFLLVQDLLKEYGTGWYQSSLGKEIVFKISQQDFIKQEDLTKIILYKKCNGSYIEYLVYNWLLKNYNEVIELHNKKLISPYEVDIYLPKLKIGIECNGYYHRDSSYINRNQDDYHKMKTNKCSNIGIKLIHIFETDINNLDTILRKEIYYGMDAK